MSFIVEINEQESLDEKTRGLIHMVEASYLGI